MTIRDRRTWGRVTDDEEIGSDTARAMTFFGALFVLALIAYAVAGCEPRQTVEMYGDEPPVETIGGIYGPADPIAPPTSGANPPPAPPITAVSDAATPTKVAVRVSPPPTTTILPHEERYPGLPCSQWADLALEVGWPSEQLPKLLRTMWRESRCQPEVRSTTSDSSLMQINDVVLRDWRFQRDWPSFRFEQIFDPRTNLAVALWLWGVDGWTPWRGGA